VGVVAAACPVLLATYFTVQGPFGAINDVGNAAVGVLSAALAWRLRRQLRNDLALGAAIAGGALTVVGSALVMSKTTGFFLAGLVSSVGFAGIGAWLVVLNRQLVRPSKLRALGTAAGALMALGVVAVPGIVLRLDDQATAPPWAWIAMVGWLGTYLAYPVWAIWFGIHERRATEPTRTHAGSTP
jgi:hypothetical protein